MADVTDLLAFIEAAPSPYHAVEEAAGRLTGAGFTELDLAEAFPAAPGDYLVRSGGALIAWQATERDPAIGFRLVGAHTDSPNLRVKPQPDSSSAGWQQLGVEIYGGALWNSWLDRDLGLSGQAIVRTPSGPNVRRFRVDRPLLRIPQLAIHLDRDVNGHGLKLDPQRHLTPIWGLGGTDAGAFQRFVADLVDADASDVVGWDAMVHDLTPGTLLGVRDELVAAPRLDNLLSCWAATRALAEAAAAPTPPAHVPVVALYDHEEVGSTSATGADGALLAQVLERIVLAAGGDREAALRALASSACASADGAHATHPNHPERHDPNHPIAIDGGPVLKVNANQRYAADPLAGALLVQACDDAGVPHQHFVSRNDLPCGSTIGPLTAARLGIATADIGVAQLAMHSARELCGATDPDRLRAALGSFLRT